jgi:hypothetical protein
VPVYVDALIAYPPTAYRGAGARQARLTGARYGHRWCHLLADTAPELEAFARRLGLHPGWCQGDHYDLTPPRRARALVLGALEASREQAVATRRAFRAVQDPGKIRAPSPG